jgi:hypothetical protein
MTLSPFINVMIIFLVFFSLFSVKFKNGVADDISKFILNYIVALFFPFILNSGFATTSGIYLLTPIEERQRKTKHILTISGMRTAPYWIGLFIADYILFAVPVILFTIFVEVMSIPGFSEHIFYFVGGMFGFGFGIISLTYLVSLMFGT